MQAGYFQPLNNRFKLGWIWWVITLSFHQIIFIEISRKWNLFTISLGIFVIIYLYFLVRQRRFLVSRHHLYLTLDFRLKMLEFDCDKISAVRVSSNTTSFVYGGKYYELIIRGKSKKLLLELFAANNIDYTVKEKKYKLPFSKKEELIN